jgi:spermidine dehydrogenase
VVRKLIPAAMPGSTVSSIVTSRADYSQLDKDSNPVRLRLSSIVTHVANNDSSHRKSAVNISYRRQGKTFMVRARDVVLACYNMMIPYICPDMPEPQKAALHSLIKTPLVYSTVALRNWRPFVELGVQRVSCPTGYHVGFGLVPAQHIGTYQTPRSPDEATLSHMVRTPAQPGLGEREQHKAGRRELLSTPFAAETTRGPMDCF